MSLATRAFSEQKLRPELDHARPTAAEAGIGLRDVGSLRDRCHCQERLVDVPIRVRCGIRHNLRISGCTVVDISWNDRVRGKSEVRMIENIEEFSSQLKA